MSNLLLDAANWSDGTVSPPAAWDGSKYVFTAPVTLTYNGTVKAGDTLGGAIASTSTGDFDSGHHVAALVNGTDAITWDYANQSYPASLAITLAAGDSVVLQAKTDGCGYPPEFNLTPPPLPPLTKRLQFQVRVADDPEGTP